MLFIEIKSSSALTVFTHGITEALSGMDHRKVNGRTIKGSTCSLIYA